MMAAAIELRDRDNRQLEYINATESRYWNELRMMGERVRELESRRTETKRLKQWSTIQARKARRNGIRKTPI